MRGDGMQVARLVRAAPANGATLDLDGHLLRAFGRIDNLLDRGYIGSVIVNEGNGRFYEPGPGRSFLLGAQWSWTP